MTPRTEFLVQNPKLITTLAIKVGMPFRELDDFAQEVILQSLREPDDFDPKKSTICTYAGNFVRMRAVDYMRRLRRVPRQLVDEETVADDAGIEPA